MEQIEKIFKIRENHTTVKTEIIAGLTTFMTMAYILAVNPNILAAAGMDHGAVFTATEFMEWCIFSDLYRILYRYDGNGVCCK